MTNTLRKGYGVSTIFKHRKRVSNRNPGGGVAVLYKTNKLNITLINFQTKYEVLLCKIKLFNNSRPMFVFIVYYPPKLRAAEVRESMEEISMQIAKLKTEHRNPHVLIAGDVNQFSVHKAIADHDDLIQLDAPPTRGAACLDIMASNFNNEVVECFFEALLETRDAVPSDHGVLVARINLKHRHEFKWIRYRTR